MARMQRVAAMEGITWTVVDDAGSVIEAAEAYLEYARAAEYSPNTVRGYAKSLSLWWTHLEGVQRSWDAVTTEDLARFMRAVRTDQVGIPRIGPQSTPRAEATVAYAPASAPRARARDDQSAA